MCEHIFLISFYLVVNSMTMSWLFSNLNKKKIRKITALLLFVLVRVCFIVRIWMQKFYSYQFIAKTCSPVSFRIKNPQYVLILSLTLRLHATNANRTLYICLLASNWVHLKSNKCVWFCTFVRCEAWSCKAFFLFAD